MTAKKVFLDASALIAAVHSQTSGARVILKLGEAGAVQLWVGPWVLREIENVLARKAPQSKTHFALLLDRAKVSIVGEAKAGALETARAVVDYLPDAQVLAEAMAAEVDYFVSLDRKHLVGNPRGGRLPFPMGTPGDFLAWYRAQVSGEG